MRRLIIFLVLLSSSISAQYDFAPLGAEWKYTYHKFVRDYPYDCEYNICNAGNGGLVVVDTTTIAGKSISVLSQGFGPMLYVHEHNDSVFFYAQDDFHLLYDFTAQDGDTIDISVPTYYTSPGTLQGTYFHSQDSILNVRVSVNYSHTVEVNGMDRKVWKYEGDNIIVPGIIDGIGSGQAFLGYSGAFVSDGCYGSFICYQDQNQSYTPFGCCEFPEPYPERTFAPLGAEWIYEGWSAGTDTDNDCTTQCVGNYMKFVVVRNRNFNGRVNAEVQKFIWDDDMLAWEPTDVKVNLYDLDGRHYAHGGFYEFSQLYDTNVAVGDTMSVTAHRSYPQWVGFDDYFMYPSNGGDQVVSSIEMIDIDGQVRKKIEFLALGDFRLGTVIEGIGPIYDGLLGYDESYPDNGCAPRLICYRDSSLTYYANEDCGCDFPERTNATVEVLSSSISITPVPVSDQLLINLGRNVEIISMTIIDMQGAVVGGGDSSLSLDVGMYPSGVYLIRFNTNKGAIIKKFIKS